MEMLKTITNINGRDIRLDFFGIIPYTADGTIAENTLEDEKQWATEYAYRDIMEGRVVEYHDDYEDEGYTGQPYVVISTKAYEPIRDPIGGWISRRLVGRTWRIDFADYIDVHDAYRMDDDGDVTPDEEARCNWLKLAYRITEVQ